jgi:hypothetical protein
MMTLVPVTKDEFYGEIFSKKLNVHPRPERDVTFWEFPNRILWGRSTPGYLCQGPKVWFIFRDVA